MAVNNRVPWRSPLSLNLRDSEYAEQEQSELFHNLEKLIASAVSICRLDGSLQCQIGGLITVIEELQRLLRHSFTEIKRLERTIDYQKQNFATTITDLHKQISNIQSSASKCIPNDTSVTISPKNTVHDMKNGGNGSFQLSKDLHKDAVKSNHVGHICLVDESYGNEEESDSSIPANVNGQPDVPDDNIVNVNAVNQSANLHDTSVHESTSIDSTVEEDKTNSTLNEVKSSENTAEEGTGNTSVENVDTSVTPKGEATQTVPPVKLTSTSVPTLIKRLGRQASPESPRTRQSRSQSSSPRMAARLNASPGRGKRITVRLVKGTRLKDSNMNQIPRKRSGTASPKSLAQMPRNLKKNTPHAQRGRPSKAGKYNSVLQGRKPKSPGRSPSSSSPKAPEEPSDRNSNLDFLLMVNQVMSELVTDREREEAALDDVKESERKNVVKLAKLYRLRVRMMGKIGGDLPVVLVKGRESCLPRPGEVDVMLGSISDTFAGKKQAGMAKSVGSKRKVDSPARSKTPTSSKSKRKKS